MNPITATFLVAISAGFQTPHPAVSAVGTWIGHVTNIKVGSNFPADKRASFEQFRQQILKQKQLLTLKTDHTFSAVVTGTPKKQPVQSGSWRQQKNKVTLLVPGGIKQQDFILSPNGTTMALHSSGQFGVSADIVFTRQK